MLVNLNDVLKKAQKEHYAVGLFNTTDSDMLEASISAAEELNSPIIIGTAEVLLPYGELSLIAPSMIAKAKSAKVPVVVNFDHGYSFDKCLEALKLGFSSLMFDGSDKPYEENIKATLEMAKIAHSFGASIEGEVGHVGNAVSNDNLLEDMYTTPKEAVDFCKATEVDALAVAIGTAHGVYKTKPNLNLQRLREIRRELDVPLVLHGGSGLSDEDFKNTIRDGIAKVNIFTDLCIAGAKAESECSIKGVDYLKSRNVKVEIIKEAIKNKMKLFGSVNKA